jgi:GntR family transcriptional regulator/MocR family aminotransferase
MHLILRLKGRRSDRRLAQRMRDAGMYAEALTDWMMASEGTTGRGEALLLNFTNIDSEASAAAFGKRILKLM